MDTGEMSIEKILAILKTRRSGGGAFDQGPFKLPGSGNGAMLHSLSRSPFKNVHRRGSSSQSPPPNGVAATMGDQLESMEDDPPIPLQRAAMNGHGAGLLEDRTDPNNNEASFVPSKETALVVINGNGPVKASNGARMGSGCGSEAGKQEGKTVTLSLEQIESARELGITMRCLSRWLECRDHFSKLRNGRKSFEAGDALRELLSFRLEAIDYAQKEGRLYAASIFRVTLSELHEWTGRRDSYVRALSGKGCIDPRAFAIVDSSSELLLHEREELARAQAIAHRVGIDLGQANRFIQQLYSSARTTFAAGNGTAS
ncbi:hypothetical protein BIW11_08524 [Tropilaelaps mercedesae]|uniref:Uncharacterized protein n=1 Tax=Tropilaelaps mercedesae TaxID=418985 RepID=A0A1V9XP83_9ACAR|nr:hypothetical protein BIW11_08524 [Tropilaelaps mercedesae]